MDATEQITALLNKRIAQVRREHGHPRLAILIATSEAAIQSGLVQPLHISVEDCAGTIMRSTVRDGDISYEDEKGGSDFRFPLRVLITDEGVNGEMIVNVETEQIEDDWIFRTQVFWLRK